MKNIILFLITFLVLDISAQTPIFVDFNSQPSNWTMINGSGYQTYGGGNYWLTTNIGTTPYPNSSTVTMTSPTYNLSNCVGTMTLSFLLNGIIQNNNDYMYFEYFNAGSWTTVGTYTGAQSNVNVVFTTIPVTTTQFRFRLVTNGSVNAYCTWFHPIFGCLSTAVYYYDIDNFNITCSSYLPIELLSFNGENLGSYNNLKWTTASEINNDYFTIQRSEDGYNWDIIGKVDGSGNSTDLKSYSLIDDSYNSVLNYYRLKQTDFNGDYKYSDITTIDNRVIDPKITKITNLLGQEINEYYSGIVIIYYDNGKNIKKIQ